MHLRIILRWEKPKRDLICFCSQKKHLLLIQQKLLLLMSNRQNILDFPSSTNNQIIFTYWPQILKIFRRREGLLILMVRNIISMLHIKLMTQLSYLLIYKNQTPTASSSKLESISIKTFHHSFPKSIKSLLGHKTIQICSQWESFCILLRRRRKIQNQSR